MREEGRSPEQLERELGVSAETLRNWRRQKAVDVGERETAFLPAPASVCFG
jgi:transposase-like protein